MKNKIIAVIVLTCLFLCFGGIVTLGWFIQTPSAGKKISAFMMSAEYLGSDGVVLQTKQNNCGPSALKMIFDYYKIPSTLAEIECNIDLTENGSSMLALKEMAQLKGLKADGWRLTMEDFMKNQFPLLLFIHKNHYVVADSVVNSDVFIRDPGIGRLRISKHNLENIWQGETLFFH